jgi:hypothetical protein
VGRKGLVAILKTGLLWGLLRNPYGPCNLDCSGNPADQGEELERKARFFFASWIAPQSRRQKKCVNMTAIKK